MFDEPESLRSFYERSLCEQYNPFSRFCQRPFRNSIEKFPPGYEKISGHFYRNMV